ncbi:MAG TPA: PEP-CTERM sorting domain-containing protein [Verrucomicrobiae bacterium]|nr:PEP-CTERM sorting domain-containing protein [Verrucomicrobiae bacterium]
MKLRSLLLPFTLFVLLALCSVPARSQTVVTFDDLVVHPIDLFTNVPNVYRGLGWSNFFAEAPIPMWTNGYFYGVVSLSNAVANGAGLPAEIDAVGTNFNFFSAYLTGAWMSNLNVQVEGFRGGDLIYNLTVTAAATNATLFTFDYEDIDRLTFSSFGGQNAGFSPGGPGEQFVMDNLLFAFVPEPSTLLLVATGAVPLAALLRRRRG